MDSNRDGLGFTSAAVVKARAASTRRARVLGVLAAVAVGALSSGQAASATAGDGLLSILVMGDSYSAGNGAGSYYGGTCSRSAHNYGREFQRIVQAAPYRQTAFVRTIACSGDTTAAFTHKTSSRAPQVDAVEHSYDLIFLTIAGNDLKFKSIVRYCLVAESRDGANCGPLLAQAEQKLADGTIAGRLRSVLAAVQARADPTASIVVLGYPYLEGDPGYRLRSGHGGHTFIEVGRRLRNIEDAGDKLQQHEVDALNKPGAPRLLFVKTKALFAAPRNHELYAQRSNPHRWFIQPFVDEPPVRLRLWYHPNPTGWYQEARLLASDPRVPKADPPALPGPAGSSAAALLGRWTGPVTQTPAPYTNYGASIKLEQLERVGDVAGQIDYPELSCGGILTYLGPSDDGGVLLRETLTYGTSRCIDAGTVHLTPIDNGGGAHFSWTKEGDNSTADAVLRRPQS